MMPTDEADMWYEAGDRLVRVPDGTRISFVRYMPEDPECVAVARELRSNANGWTREEGGFRLRPGELATFRFEDGTNWRRSVRRARQASSMPEGYRWLEVGDVWQLGDQITADVVAAADRSFFGPFEWVTSLQGLSGRKIELSDIARLARGKERRDAMVSDLVASTGWWPSGAPSPVPVAPTMVTEIQATPPRTRRFKL